MNRIAIDSSLQAQLDRLAGGDLPESERSNLLAWLDEDATRWRACGLAFLEAQMWQAAAPVPAESGERAVVQPASDTPSTTTRRDGPRVSLLALSAAVALAFASGAVLASWLPLGVGRSANLVVKDREPPTAPADGHTQIATVPVRTNLNAPLMLQLPVSTEAGAPATAEGSSVSEYDRQRWEKLGFEVVEELRYLPARLPDGRTVMVPVNRVQLKFKGTPVS